MIQIKKQQMLIWANHKIMKQSPKLDDGEKNRFEQTLTKIWNNPVGKVSVMAAASLGLALAIGGIFKAGAFAMNAYMDFPNASKQQTCLSC